MRVIAGLYGGRQLATPKGFKTHPMSEKMRGALFNILGDLQDKTVWDAFAGSGAIALESASRGARWVLATDNFRGAVNVMKENVASLKAVEKVKVVSASAQAWGKTNPDAKFDIIICDPPYNDMQLSTISALKAHLKPNGLMLLSYPGREPVPSVNGVVVVDNRNYGDSALATYRLE
jgi:16S rRNA (guanine966-N2)-methyltransferase